MDEMVRSQGEIMQKYLRDDHYEQHTVKRFFSCYGMTLNDLGKKLSGLYRQGGATLEQLKDLIENVLRLINDAKI